MAKKSRKLGDGTRSKGRAAQAAQNGAKNPAAVAASAARKVYGKRADTLAAAGRRRAQAEREAGGDTDHEFRGPPKPKPSRRTRV